MARSCQTKEKPTVLILKDIIMKSYIVLYRIESIMCESDAPFGFQCFAEDKMHAAEQCQDAYPDCDVVYVHEAQSTNAGQYDLALAHYYK